MIYREVCKSRDCRIFGARQRYWPPKYIFIQILRIVLLSHNCASQHQPNDWDFSPQPVAIFELSDHNK